MNLPKYDLQKMIELTSEWSLIAYLANAIHYIRMFSALCEAIIECYSCMGDSYKFV